MYSRLSALRRWLLFRRVELQIRLGREALHHQLQSFFLTVHSARLPMKATAFFEVHGCPKRWTADEILREVRTFPRLAAKLKLFEPISRWSVTEHRHPGRPANRASGTPIVLAQ